MNNTPGNNNILIIGSDTCYLEKVEIFLNSILTRAEIDRTKFKRLLLCVSEGVLNAVIHGNKNKVEKLVRIETELDDKEILVTIKDEGDGFNFNEIPNPTINENLKKEKGRGLHIIRTYADEVKFENKGSVLKIKFNLRAED